MREDDAAWRDRLSEPRPRCLGQTPARPVSAKANRLTTATVVKITYATDADRALASNRKRCRLPHLSGWSSSETAVAGARLMITAASACFNERHLTNLTALLSLCRLCKGVSRPFTSLWKSSSASDAFAAGIIQQIAVLFCRTTLSKTPCEKGTAPQKNFSCA